MRHAKRGGSRGRRGAGGWSESGRALAASGHDALVWPEFGTEADAELAW